MSLECFVPNCKNSIGVPFPRDQKVKKEWLEGLKIKKGTPEAGDFVCLDHFKPSDINNDIVPSGTRASSRIKRGAIPCIPNPKKAKEDKTEKITDQSSTECKEDEPKPKKRKVPGKSKIPENDSKKELATDTKEEKNNEVVVPIEENIDDMRMCRVCMTEKNIEKRITDNIDRQATILATLMLCAFPLEVSKTDNLPKFICKECLGELKQAHNFRLKCLTTDEVLQKRFAQSLKRKQEQPVSEVGSNKKAHLIDTQKNQDSDETIKHHEQTNGATVYRLQMTYDDCRVPDELDADQIEKNMEEIHRTSENESTIRSISTEVEKVSLEHVLNTLEDRAESKNEPKKKSPSKIIVKRFSSISDLKKTLAKQPEKSENVYESKTGPFESSVYTGTCDSSFCLADGYLFEFGLVKQGVRHLKCIVPNCDATASQKQLESGSFEDLVEVEVAHNHIQGNEDDLKKQIFLNVVKKKMQNDRSLNLRNIYEQLCAQDPDIKPLIPLRSVINEICKHQLFNPVPSINSFEDFFHNIESDRFEKLHFTRSWVQFYQEKFETEDGGMAVVFGNSEVIQQISGSKLMYVDASFKIETHENFQYQLVTVLVWVDDSYYPIVFALINRKTQHLFKLIFAYLHDVLAPDLRPQEIVTDYEANLYYALGETYVDSHIGGSVFYYTQNLYKKICSLNLSRDLETNSFFRNVYHMLLMLPLLPVNTILDGLNNIEVQARDLNLMELTRPIFDHVRSQWMINVTPDLFCVHRLENRINENVIAPFKKLRDFLLLTKGKMHKSHVTIITIVEKLIELDGFLQNVYSKPDKRSFGRDLSSYQKKNVLRAWQFIETHPKININNFFSKVLGYIKCMENQLWIWGFYRYDGDVDEALINAVDFSIIGSNSSENEETENISVPVEEIVECNDIVDNTVVVETVIDNEIILQNNENVVTTQVPSVVEDKQFESAFLKYVYQ